MMKGSPYNSQAQGQVESANKIIIQELRIMERNGKKWTENLQTVVEKMNQSKQASLGMSPSNFLMEKSFKEDLTELSPIDNNQVWKRGNEKYTPYKKGQWVLKRTRIKGSRVLWKYNAPFEGPYEIKKIRAGEVSYTIEHVVTKITQNVPYRKLKIFHKVNEYLNQSSKFKNWYKNTWRKIMQENNTETSTKENSENDKDETTTYNRWWKTPQMIGDTDYDKSVREKIKMRRNTREKESDTIEEEQSEEIYTTEYESSEQKVPDESSRRSEISEEEEKKDNFGRISPIDSTSEKERIIKKLKRKIDGKWEIVKRDSEKKEERWHGTMTSRTKKKKRKKKKYEEESDSETEEQKEETSGTTRTDSETDQKDTTSDSNDEEEEDEEQEEEESKETETETESDEEKTESESSDAESEQTTQTTELSDTQSETNSEQELTDHEKDENIGIRGARTRSRGPVKNISLPDRPAEYKEYTRKARIASESSGSNKSL